MPKNYRVKQRTNILLNAFNITVNGEKDPVYKVMKSDKDKSGQTLSFRDAKTGQEMATMVRKYELSIKPKFSVRRDGQFWADFAAEKIFLKKELILDIYGPHDYKIIGNFMASKWKIHRTSDESETVVATIDKKWGLSDTYDVMVEDDQDDIAVLLIVILIDQSFTRNHRRHD